MKVLTEEAVESGQPAAETKKPAVWVVMWRVLATPVRGFESLKEHPRWLIPGMLCVFVLLAQEVLVNPYTLMEMKQTIQNETSFSPAEAQARIQMIDNQLRYGVTRGLLLKGLILLTIIHFGKIFVLSCLLWGVAQLVKGGASFRRVLRYPARHSSSLRQRRC